MNFVNVENKQKALERASFLTARKVSIFTRAVSKHNIVIFKPSPARPSVYGSQQIKYRPGEMQLLLNSAIYKKLSDGTWFAEIPSCKGVWVNQTDKRECEKELSEVLAEWRMLKQPVKTRRGALAA